MRECAALVGAAAKACAPATRKVDRRFWPALSGALAGALLCFSVVFLAPSGTVVAPAAVASAGGRAGAAAGVAAGLPPAARLAVSRVLGADERPYWSVRAGADLVARNGAQHLAMRFATSGVTVTTPAGRVWVALRGVSAAGRTVSVRSASPAGHANRVSYRRGAITEWYVNGPSGLEQGFTIARPTPAGARDSLALSLTLRTSGELRARAAAGGVDLLVRGRAALRYGGLTVVDARGRALPAWMSLRGARLVLHVRTARAAFPITVDPIVQDGVLLAGDGQAGDALGQSVAVSGPLVAVGAPDATVGGQTDAGAVYLFSEPSGGWANATSAVQLTSASPTVGDGLGTSVAISGDTVFAGAPGAGQSSGAVPFFTEPSGGWASEVDDGELTEPGAVPGDQFGYALAASGSTLVVGAPGSMSYSGSVDVFGEPAGGWAAEGPVATLATTTAGLDGLGFSVAISGPTIVAGAPFADSLAGQVDVYTEPSGGWTSAGQTALLSGCSAGCAPGVPTAGPADAMGQSVGVSGTTVIAGAPGATVNANPGQGAVYVFGEPPSGPWVNATAAVALTAASGAASDALGAAVSISGPTIFAGAPGATIGQAAAQGGVYAFSQPTGGWATATSATMLSEGAGTAGDSFGASVAVSGPSLVVGADSEYANGPAGPGAAFVFGGVVDVTANGGTTSSSTATTTSTSSSTTTTTTTTAVADSSTGSNGAAPGTAAARSSTSTAVSVSTPRNYATVTAVSGGPGLVTVALSCTAGHGKCTAVNVQLVLREELSGNRIVGTEAGAKLRLRGVVVGAGHATLTAGARTSLTVDLNPLGRSLLGSHARMAVGVSVTSVGRTLRLDTVTVTPPATARRPTTSKR